MIRDECVVSGYVRAWLSDDDGKVVPGSWREGHNVFTLTGREYLTQQISWAAWTGARGTSTPGGPLGAAGVPNPRVLYIGCGDNAGLEVATVTKLGNAVPFVAAPANTYLKAVTVPPTYPSAGVVRYSVSFLPAEISLGAPQDYNEFGLYLDSATITAVDNAPIAYKVIDTLSKTTAYTLNVEWEVRFA